MRKVILMLLTMLTMSSLGQAQGIRFEEGSWKQVLKKAKREKKVVFVDVYTSWCGPCKMVASTVFTQEKIGQFYNEHFINYKFDAEKGEGPALAKKYNVKAYPTFLYIDGDGNLIFQLVGVLDADHFIENGKKVSQYSRYGGYDKMLDAITNGTASHDLFDTYYTSVSPQEKNKILNTYLASMPADEFFREGYERIPDIGLYDVKLMDRLTDLIAQKNHDTRFSGEKDSTLVQSMNVSFQKKTSEFLKISIRTGDSLLFSALSRLQDRYKNSEWKGKRQVSDVFFDAGQLILVSPDYLQLYYWAENCLCPEQFKEKFGPYMEALIVANPAEKFKNEILMFSSDPWIFESAISGIKPFLGLTGENILTWVDYYLKISPSDAETVANGVRYIQYAYTWNFFDHEIALRAANLLVKLGEKEASIALLEDALLTQNRFKASSKAIRQLTCELQALKNK